MTASYFDRFWAAYPKHRRVSKGSAKKSFEKIKEMDEEFLKEIIGALDDQKRSRKSQKAAGNFVPNWCMPATWLNNQRWLDEVVFSHETVKSPMSSCDLCQEDATVTRNGKGFCASHWNHGEWKNKMKAQMKETGHWKLKDESIHDWQMRCRLEFFEKGYDKKVGMG